MVAQRSPPCAPGSPARVPRARTCSVLARRSLVLDADEHDGTINVLEFGLETYDSREVLRGTANHRFWSLDRNDFVEAGKLLIGERLVTPSGVAILASREAVQGTFAVYNVEVEERHTYYVGETGVLVHNNGPACPPVQPGDTGTYGDLTARRRAAGESEPLDMDHQPSYAAQRSAGVSGRRTAAHARRGSGAPQIGSRACFPANGSSAYEPDVWWSQHPGENSPGRRGSSRGRGEG